MHRYSITPPIIKPRKKMTRADILSVFTIFLPLVNAHTAATNSLSFMQKFSPGSKLLLIATMLIGRLGPLTLLAALPWKKEPAEHELTPDYPDAERIQIG